MLFEKPKINVDDSDKSHEGSIRRFQITSAL